MGGWLGGNVAVRVAAEASQAQGMGIGDEQPEHLPSRGSGPNPFLLFGIEADGEKLGQGGAILVQNPDGAVTSPGHRASLLDEVMEQGGEIQVSLELQRGLEHPAKLGRILDRPIRHPLPSVSSASAGSRPSSTGALPRRAALNRTLNPVHDT
jgi:hypothetical protein